MPIANGEGSADGGAEFDEGSVGAVEVGDSLPPGFLLGGFEFDRACGDRGAMGGGDVGGDEGDFDAEGLGGAAGGDVALGKVGLAKAVVSEGKGGFARFEFAVVAAFVEEALAESEGGFKELEGGGNVGDVDDGVAEFHGLEGGVMRSGR